MISPEIVGGVFASTVIIRKRQRVWGSGILIPALMGTN